MDSGFWSLQGPSLQITFHQGSCWLAVASPGSICVLLMGSMRRPTSHVFSRTCRDWCRSCGAVCSPCLVTPGCDPLPLFLNAYIHVLVFIHMAWLRRRSHRLIMGVVKVMQPLGSRFMSLFFLDHVLTRYLFGLQGISSGFPQPTRVMLFCRSGPPISDSNVVLSIWTPINAVGWLEVRSSCTRRFGVR